MRRRARLPKAVPKDIFGVGPPVKKNPKIEAEGDAPSPPLLDAVRRLIERDLMTRNETSNPQNATDSIDVIHVNDPSNVIEVNTDVGISGSEVIQRSGLAPRDGSTVNLYLNDLRMRPDQIIEPGSTVHLDNESIIEPIVIDHISLNTGRKRIGAGELPDGTIAHVPGSNVGEFHWVVRHIQSRSKRNHDLVHAQCHSFRVDDLPYRVGDLVRAQPSPDGVNALLFDPRTEEWSIHLSVCMPPNMDPGEVKELYRGLLWTIKITSVNDSDNRCKGMLIPSLTFNPRISRGRPGGE